MAPLGGREVPAVKRQASDFSQVLLNQTEQTTQILSFGLKCMTLGICERALESLVTKGGAACGLL